MVFSTRTKLAKRKPTGLIDTLFIIGPHTLLLDIAGPAEAFRLANLHCARRGLPERFRLRFAAPSPRTVSSVGLTLAELEPLPQRFTAPTWVVVVSQPAVHTVQVSAPMATIAQWLARMLREPLQQADSPHRLLTVCSGTLTVARAGLLGGRKCTTHHELLDLLRELAPSAQIIANRVFVVDGPLASSAGVTAGMDLALHMIATECGEALAASVAADMVMYLRRTPHDPELSPYLTNRQHLHGAVHRVQDAINADPDRDWNMTTLAAVAHVTERHLLRIVTQHAGVSPLRYLQTIRLERARQSLEGGSSVTRAAEQAGFHSGVHLRRAWRRQWGSTPRTATRN
ncbi:MAG: GlxA family transcriptional regulator [Burkholderiaceae bacterium]